MQSGMPEDSFLFLGNLIILATGGIRMLSTERLKRPQQSRLLRELQQVDSDEINSTTREVPNEFEFKRQGLTVALFQG